MKIPGTVYLALTIYFLSLVLLTWKNSIQEFKVKNKPCNHAKKRSSDEHTLLNGENLENVSSYFDISDFNRASLKVNSMEQISPI